MTECDLLVTGGLLVDAVEGVHEDDTLCVAAGRILEVGCTDDLTSRYEPKRSLDASGKIVLPGLVNGHTHASATLFRGYAADVAGKGFFDRMWRIERLLTAEDVYVGARAGCLEMIKNGVTGFANHFSYMDEVARAVDETGIRAGLSRTMLDKGDQDAAQREVEEGVAFAERWSDRCPRIQPMLGPHAAYTCSDGLLRRAAEEARRRGLTLHLHLAENDYEQQVMARRTGTTAIQHLDRMGFFEGNRVLGAHTLLPDDKDLEVLRKHDFHAAVCVTGKMNRGHGIANIPRMLDAGINVCLGTDGSASDNLDVLMAMKVTHIAQNYLHRKVCALSPTSVLRLATGAGATALKWEAGRLAAGQLADFVLLDMNRPHLRPLITSPRSNVVFNIVYYATGADVDSVVIDGKLVMQDRKMLTVDENEILDQLQTHAQRLWERADLQ
jgi:5-methylthioadenosine/S-adenosylhomocysteine deaminase